MQEENEDEEDFLLYVKKFHKFVKNRRIERHQNFNNGKRSQEGSLTLKCYKCNQPGHIKAHCPTNESWPEKNEKKSHEERRSKKAYIAWEGVELHDWEIPRFMFSFIFLLSFLCYVIFLT